MACAFPTLFPTGAADLSAPRVHSVSRVLQETPYVVQGRSLPKHPRFQYFALNTEMHWRALQTGRLYVRQHPQDARLSVEELREMVGQAGTAFSNRVVHFGSCLRGT